MKLFWAILLVSTSVFAENKRDIIDIMYLPEDQTSFVSFIHDFNSGGIKYKNSDNVTFEAELYRAIVGQSYGNFSAALVLSHLKSFSDSTSSEYKAEGMRDPEFELRYRLLENDFLLDLKSTLLWSIGDKELGNKYGNALRGGHELFLAAELGQKKASSQYSLTFGVRHYFEADKEFTSSNSTIINDSHNGFLLRADYLSVFNSKFSLKTFAEFSYEEGYQDNDFPVNHIPDVKTFILGLRPQFRMINNFLFFIEPSYQKIVTNEGVIDSFEAFNWSLGATYQF